MGDVRTSSDVSEDAREFFGRPEGELAFRAGEFDGWMVLAGAKGNWSVLAFTHSEKEAEKICSDHWNGPLHYESKTNGAFVVRATLKGSGILSRLPWPKEPASSADRAQCSAD